MAMASTATAPSKEEQRTAKALHIDLSGKIHPAGVFGFFLVLVAGGCYAVYSIASDIRTYGGGEPIAVGAFLLLALALLIALGFEFVNGFHDTANAVATVIYTRTPCSPQSSPSSGRDFSISSAWPWSSGGAVAFGIVSHAARGTHSPDRGAAAPASPWSSPCC